VVLDGVLRYVPMAALFDGNKYLIENYNTVTITPESIPHLADQPDLTGMSAVGMGISKQVQEGTNSTAGGGGRVGPRGEGLARAGGERGFAWKDSV